MTRWPEAFSRVVPEVTACVITLGFVACAGHAIVTRWPEAFSRVVPEGDALAYDFRVSSFPKCYCDHDWMARSIF